MNRYLIFDSGCSVCSELAREIVRTSEGWVVAKSLRDPSIQSMLDRSCPRWKWEPMLMEVNGDRTRVYIGIAMQVQILFGLGPKRALQLLQLLRSFGAPASELGVGRRDFLRQVGTAVAGFVVLGAPSKLSKGQTLHNNSPQVLSSKSEIYNGFLLLADNDPIPDFVQPSRLGIPIACRVGEGNGKYALEAVTKPFKQPIALERAAKFPIYTLKNLPANARQADSYLIKHMSGEVYGAVVSYETPEPKSDEWEGSIGIFAQPDFMHPYPLWSSSPVEPNGPSVILEKVDFLPTPGIMIATQAGYVFYWIQKDIFYTLRAEYELSRKEAEVLARSLTLIK